MGMRDLGFERSLQRAQRENTTQINLTKIEEIQSL